MITESLDFKTRATSNLTRVNTDQRKNINEEEKRNSKVENESYFDKLDSSRVFLEAVALRKQSSKNLRRIEMKSR